MGRFLFVVALCWTSVFESSHLLGADWPMWRGDASRSNSSPAELSLDLKLSWVRQLTPPRPAWPASQSKLQFDAAYQPIVIGSLIVVGSTVNDSVTAFDTDRGNVAWQFFTDGPVRFAPAASQGRIYVGSDDGYLYCLEANSGKLLWKFNGGPTDRRIIGNDRLVSSWPIRGGPAVADGVVYFTASIWPFMGIFVHAVDAETGQSIWTNSETGSRWITHPHGAPSFGSVVPQGYLAVSGDRVVVPGGRSLPAVFNRQSGELEHFQFGGKGSGGWNVCANDKMYVVGRTALALASGTSIGSFDAHVLTNDFLINGMAGVELSGGFKETETEDRRGNKVKKLQLVSPKSWEIGSGSFSTGALIGTRYYSAGDGKVACFDFSKSRSTGKSQTASWTAAIDGKAESVFGGDDKLFVVTQDGKIICFDDTDREPIVHEVKHDRVTLKLHPSFDTRELVAKKADVDGGYAVVLGIASGSYIDHLIATTKLRVIAIDPDRERVEKFRRLADSRGWYGTRVTAHVGDPSKFSLPPYLANLVIHEPPLSKRPFPFDLTKPLVRAMFQTLRPYGGTAILNLTDAEHDRLNSAVKQLKLEGALVRRDKTTTYLERSGPLPGASDWTHQYADAANSVVSKDQLVKAPLGLLWFGGPPNDKVLPRHGHGPSPQVAGGRLVIEGADMLRCVDVYTGRVLWQRDDLKGLGNYYNKTSHFPGAGEIGSNYVTMDDFVYVIFGKLLMQLNAATGKTESIFGLSGDDSRQQDEAQTKPFWGFISADGDYLVATSNPYTVADSPKENKADQPSSFSRAIKTNQYSSTSRDLVVFNRFTGKTLWSRKAEFGFRHNCIVIAGKTLFCIDGMSSAKLNVLQRRGIAPTAKPRLLALEAATGKTIWSTTDDVFGTFLNYSAEHDVLVQAGSAYRDRAKDEVGKGIVSYRGTSGDVLWKDLSRSYGGPCLLWRDKIITNGGGGYQMELLTGKETGWKYKRMYGCNTAVGSEHLLTFRSGAAGFCDLTGDSGTGNLGGFRSSCTANLIAADGVLNAPDYTRTCSCAYQNQSSLALVHMPEAEMWTFSGSGKLPNRFGINLGAPGDRRDADGQMWFDFPSVGGSSPSLPVKHSDEKNVRFVRHHASRLRDESNSHAWIGSTAAIGISKIEQQLPGDNKELKLRLFFAELEDLAPSQRIFDVLIAGKTVIKDLDIAREAGTNQLLVKDVSLGKDVTKLELSFRASKGQPCLSGFIVVEP